MNWCERAGVHYVIGLARNARLEEQVQYAQLMLAEHYERSGAKQRLVAEFTYAANSWAHERRVVTRLEWGSQGGNPRFVVTNLEHPPQQLYDELYCQRGEAENRIKEAQVGLFATRTSCHHFAANQLRVLLAALAYVLIERMRTLGLQGTRAGHRAGRHATHPAAQARCGGHAHHAARAAVLRVELAERADLRAGHARAGRLVALIQCLARALTPRRPATQAGEGVTTRRLAPLAASGASKPSSSR
jgi:hypothetical protein